jgi:hypothetical protein
MSEGDENKRAPYNWIDIAMLIVSALTPLMLFGLGVVVARSSSEETLRREAAVRQETRIREDAATRKAERREAYRDLEALERDKRNREEARRDAQLARDEAKQDARAARGDAFARERVLQADVEKKADAVRREILNNQRMAYLLEKRAQGWAVLGPLASDLSLAIRSFNDATKEEFIQEWRKEVYDLQDTIFSKFTAYLFYFGPEFQTILNEFTKECDEFVSAEYPSTKDKEAAYDRLISAYLHVINEASRMADDPTYKPPMLFRVQSL